MLNSEYIGDDCAYLKDLGIVVTQDSLVENVHFCMDFITPFQLGYKSVMVNISDVAASGAEPKYLTVSLSLPADIDSDFVREFYLGAKKPVDRELKLLAEILPVQIKFLFLSVQSALLRIEIFHLEKC